MSISSTAKVSPRASLGARVKIGDFTIVHDDVVLADDTEVGSHCVLGEPSAAADGKPLEIGANSLIRSHSVFYAGSTFGPKLTTGHRVTVRELISAGTNLQIGTLSDLQGRTSIGDYVRTHSNVHIGQHSRIGSFVWIFPYTVLTNDPHPPSHCQLGVTVEDYAVIATMVCVLPGVTVGSRSFVAAHSMVTRDVEPDMLVAGVPAKQLGLASKIRMRDGSDEPAYPWTRHFRRGYPSEVTETWPDTSH